MGNTIATRRYNNRNVESRPHAAPLGVAVRLRLAPQLALNLALLSVVIEYKDQEQITELCLRQDIFTKLAFEAAFRDVRIGELVGALIVATMEKDLSQLILDSEKGAKTPQTWALREIRMPEQVKAPDRRQLANFIAFPRFPTSP